jgi:VanZ family protein
MATIRNKKILFWFAVVLWLAVIFFLSSMKGSGTASYSLVYFIERKFFHVLEYFILASLFYGAFLQSYPKRQAVLFSLVCSLVYAFSDEWHQTFIFGREGAVRDIAIDFLGIFAAVIFISNFKKWKK